MKICVEPNKLYLVGTFAEVLQELHELSKKYLTVEEVINNYLH